MPARWTTPLLVLAACAALLLASTPADAAEVTVVSGDRAAKRDDPLVPPPVPADVGPAGASVRAFEARDSKRKRGRRAVLRSLRRAYRGHLVDLSTYRGYLGAYRRARSVGKRLRGARRIQLRYVIASLERLALKRELIPSRMPEVFLTLRRNTQYWRSLPYPAPSDQVAFRGSELLFQYYPGRGFQLQPLSTFKKANLMHGACQGVVKAPCRPDGLRRLLDEMSQLAVRRSPGFIAWEYLFDFGGGSPPWMSGMAQATGIQALARAAQLLSQPSYLDVARNALGAFETGPHMGVRARGFAGGVHYLQYSFAPRLYIFNAFTQSLLGLYDFWKITGDPRARALYDAAAPELEREVPASDVGDWSRYSYRGHESDRSYHELLREVLQSACSRRFGDVYCRYARLYRSYQQDPAALDFVGPPTASEGKLERVVFDLSKLSAVEITITKDGHTDFHRIASFRRGRRSFAWRPSEPGTYTVRLAAKELRTGRELRTRTSGVIEVK
jgi:hypothetical protein